MIAIDLGTIEYYDGKKNEFVYLEGGIVRFEYSLKVLYEWEARWRKPFLKGDLNEEELVDFYLRMALDPIDPQFMTYDVMEELSKYVGTPQTATTFSSVTTDAKHGNGFNKAKIYTAEELYALMFANNIPLDFENRNLNRLFVILRIISSYNSPPKKMSKQDIYKQNAQLNAQRKAQFKTKG